MENNSFLKKNMTTFKEIDSESSSIKSFSTEDSGLSSIESFTKHLSKMEDPIAIEKFAVILQRSILYIEA